MPTPLARMFGRSRSRNRRGGDLGHGLRLAAALVESDRPLRVLGSACRLAMRTPGCNVALVGLRSGEEPDGGPPSFSWPAGGCRRIDRRLLEEALQGRHSPLPLVGEQPLWIRMVDDPFQPGTPVLRRFELAWLLVLPGRMFVDGDLREGVVVLGGSDARVEPDHPLIRDARLIWLATRDHLSKGAFRFRQGAASPWPAIGQAWQEAPAALALVDRDKVLAVNGAARRMLAESVGKDEGRCLGWLLGAVHRLDASGRTSEVLAACGSGERCLEVTAGVPLPDGGTRLVALHRCAVPAADPGDQESAMRMLGHELRTPLTAMQTSLDLVLRGEAGPLSGDQTRFLGATRRNLDRLGRLLGDLLENRHAAARGHHAIEEKTFDLGALLHDELGVLEVVCREKGVVLERSGVPANLIACVDVDKVQQMLHNIVGNAIKYTAAGGVVRVALQEPLECAPGLGPRLAHWLGLPLNVLTLVVEDTGLGMSENFLATLFEPFNREDRAELRGLPGAGLGLHITRGLVEAHGGLIKIASKPGRGTTVWLALPREPESGRVLTVGRQITALRTRALASGLPGAICALDLRDRLAGSHPWQIEAAVEQALAFLSRLGRMSDRSDVAEFADSAGAIGWQLAPGLCCGLALDPPRLPTAWQVAAAAPESVGLLLGTRWRDLEDVIDPAEAGAPSPSPLGTGRRPERVGV